MFHQHRICFTNHLLLTVNPLSFLTFMLSRISSSRKHHSKWARSYVLHPSAKITSSFSSPAYNTSTASYPLQPNDLPPVGSPRILYKSKKAPFRPKFMLVLPLTLLFLIQITLTDNIFMNSVPHHISILISYENVSPKQQSFIAFASSLKEP